MGRVDHLFYWVKKQIQCSFAWFSSLFFNIFTSFPEIILISSSWKLGESVLLYFSIIYICWKRELITFFFVFTNLSLEKKVVFKQNVCVFKQMCFLINFSIKIQIYSLLYIYIYIFLKLISQGNKTC